MNALERIHTAFVLVEKTKAAFEARWTYDALKRASNDIAGRLEYQVTLWDQALIDSDPNEVDRVAAAMLRGYVAATSACEAARQPEDAYIVGHDLDTGLTLVIGRTLAILDTDPAKWAHHDTLVLTADQVAQILAGSPSLLAIAETFPGAHIKAVRPT